MLQSNISKSSTHPVLEKIIKISESLYIQRLQFKVRIKNQECDQELSSPASSSWWPLGKSLWLSRCQHEEEEEVSDPPRQDLSKPPLMGLLS